MLAWAILARVDLKLIEDGLVLIAEKAEVVIVHLRLLQVLDQVVVLEIVNH